MKKMAMKMYMNWLNLKEGFRNDEAGNDTIVAIVVMIGIVIVLAVLFRKNIESLLGTLFESINDGAAEAVKPA